VVLSRARAWRPLWVIAASGRRAAEQRERSMLCRIML
jgi:hypothetical protein